MRVRTVLCTVATAAVLAVPAPAAAAYPAQSTLMLTLATTHSERAAGLLCSPPGGTHPHAIAACGDLAQADGVQNLPQRPRRGFCPDLYQGITASATGTWNGQTVNWTHIYPNSCYLSESTGAVFDF